MLNKMPGVPTRSIYDVNKSHALFQKRTEVYAEESRAAKESRVVTIKRYETFLYELHNAVRRLESAFGLKYGELDRFLEEHSK